MGWCWKCPAIRRVGANGGGRRVLMSKPYDATTKFLLESHPLDWLRFAGLPSGKVTVVDADVSTISLAADKVFRVEAPDPYIAHFELQASADPWIDRPSWP